MPHWLMMVLIGSFFGLAQAQERSGYVGFGVSYATFTGVIPNYPAPSLQVGGPVSDALELRGTLESLLVVSNIGLDLLYPPDRSRQWTHASMWAVAEIYACFSIIPAELT